MAISPQGTHLPPTAPETENTRTDGCVKRVELGALIDGDEFALGPDNTVDVEKRLAQRGGEHGPNSTREPENTERFGAASGTFAAQAMACSADE